MFRESERPQKNGNLIVCGIWSPKIVKCPFCNGKGHNGWFGPGKRDTCGYCQGSGNMEKGRAEWTVNNNKLNQASTEANWRRTHRSFP